MIRKMNERIDIEKFEVEADEIGNHMAKDKPYYSCYAYASTFSNRSGEEGEFSDNEEISFTVRYAGEIADISSNGYRVKFRDVPYNIVLVDFSNYDHKYIKLKCFKDKTHEKCEN